MQIVWNWSGKTPVLTPSKHLAFFVTLSYLLCRCGESRAALKFLQQQIVYWIVTSQIQLAYTVLYIHSRTGNNHQRETKDRKKNTENLSLNKIQQIKSSRICARCLDYFLDQSKHFDFRRSRACTSPPCSPGKLGKFPSTRPHAEPPRRITAARGRGGGSNPPRVKSKRNQHAMFVGVHLLLPFVCVCARVCVRDFLAMTSFKCVEKWTRSLHSTSCPAGGDVTPKKFRRFSTNYAHFMAPQKYYKHN